ncbi:MAG: hypothetical protein KDA57_19785, partial [Planctomycetales bacterium]|nr:hypothetical protein [Planctomycetales bacterium]
VKVAKEIGLPLEEFAPYKVGNWYSEFSQEVYADAATRKVLASYELTSYTKVLDFHRSGMGGTIWGVPWEFGRGWHAIAGVGHTKDGQLRIANSWGEHWDEDGYIEWNENKINRYLAVDGVVCYGLSDLSVPQIRPYPFSERFFG